MFSMSKIKLCMFVWLVCIAVILINTSPVTAQGNSNCVSCDNVPIDCPQCPGGAKCVLSIRTCFECPKPSCVKTQDSSDSGNNGNKILLPAVISGILGVGLLAAIGYCSFVRRRRTQKERGVRLDSNDEMTSLDGENVIPIAYIPSTVSSPTTPEQTYHLRLQLSNSAGTTPLASPLPRNLSDEQLIDIVDDDDITPDIGTILQATKTAPAASTATLVTATRAKPALVRLNTIKKDMSPIQPTRSEDSAPNTPNTPVINNTFLNAPSSVPASPTSNVSTIIGGDSDNEHVMHHIDIEVPSPELSNQNTLQNLQNPQNPQNPQNQNLNLCTSDPIEGRQSFGLFGSDEVYSNEPQLHRESILSSSSNGRSTVFSDDGDGEIMIFWGGNTPPFVTVTGEGGQIQVKEPENHVDSTDKDQNKEITSNEST